MLFVNRAEHTLGWGRLSAHDNESKMHQGLMHLIRILCTPFSTDSVDKLALPTYEHADRRTVRRDVAIPEIAKHGRAKFRRR
ncbi:hypothetical protein LMG29542_08472 [Paraburkholderia humisilvae]|uniref:Uncharacterized protein n=1 Tax=Paraburkholderia humisilvae TaxID=627669 RepID=A0A6J5F8C8_9BURK|nr:hypothetical protein LMG29542_08472 [Paraburkholderia humisilvae]